MHTLLCDIYYTQHLENVKSKKMCYIKHIVYTIYNVLNVPLYELFDTSL